MTDSARDSAVHALPLQSTLKSARGWGARSPRSLPDKPLRLAVNPASDLGLAGTDQ